MTKFTKFPTILIPYLEQYLEGYGFVNIIMHKDNDMDKTSSVIKKEWVYPLPIEHILSNEAVTLGTGNKIKKLMVFSTDNVEYPFMWITIPLDLNLHYHMNWLPSINFGPWENLIKLHSEIKNNVKM